MKLGLLLLLFFFCVCGNFPKAHVVIPIDLIRGRINLMEGASIFEVSYINTDASTRRERCTFLYLVAQISKTSQQQVKNKEKWRRGALTEPRCRAFKKFHATI
jgi:hypothetical protein